MPEPIGYLNGRWLPVSELALPVSDAGLVQGVAVSEQMRTFGGRLFRVSQHLERLAHSLEIVGFEPDLSLAQLADVAQELVAHNHPLLAADDDLGLSLFITPGAYPTFVPDASPRPTVCLHTYPLPFSLWHSKYATGQRLVVSSVRQVPANCWPVELKCRSRMHYFLADREAGRREPGARALLLDQAGCVTEASTANVLLYRRREGLVSPPRERILPGVSVAVLEELAADCGIPFGHRELSSEEFAAADEVLLCSTSPCVLPVCSLDGRAIGGGAPGQVFERLLARWSESVGVDIRRQAQQFADRA